MFVVAGDGCLQEGVSHEAASLAGHLGIGRLVYIYDDNHITIDGPTELSYSDDVPKRFAGYGWHVVELGEVANDLDAIEGGIRAGMAEAERPSIVILRSHIGYPSPKYTDTAFAHGNAARRRRGRGGEGRSSGFPKTTSTPRRRAWRTTAKPARGAAPARLDWERRRVAFNEREPSLNEEYDACLEQRGLEGLGDEAPHVGRGRGDSPRVARRARSSKRSSTSCPPLIAGGADLSENTGTLLEGAPVISKHLFGGRQLHFGIREHGMGSIMNGMSVSGLIPAGGTFFVFSDYMRPAVRLAALSQYKTAFVWTHDSIGVGEDGPTHQPIEQLASLRAMPELNVIRPADANESAQAWRFHIDGEHPTAIVLARQNVPVLAGTAERSPEGLPRGAYVLVDEGEGPDIVLVGTGSEVSLCVDARELLAADGLSARVVSFPSWELFAAQDVAYRDSVLPPGGAEARGRSGRELRLGALRRRRRRHRPFRRVGARWNSHEGIRVHTRERCRARHTRCSKQEALDDERDRPAQRLRPEPVVRQPGPPAAHRRRAGEARHRGRHPGGHVEPDDPRQGDRRR